MGRDPVIPFIIVNALMQLGWFFSLSRRLINVSNFVIESHAPMTSVPLYLNVPDALLYCIDHFINSGFSVPEQYISWICILSKQNNSLSYIYIEVNGRGRDTSHKWLSHSLWPLNALGLSRVVACQSVQFVQSVFLPNCIYHTKYLLLTLWCHYAIKWFPREAVLW